MSRMKNRAVAQSKVLAREAAHDGAVGAALGLLVVSGLVACNLDMRDALTQSSAPLSSLVGYVGMVVAEAAIVATLCGLALRRFAARD